MIRNSFTAAASIFLGSYIASPAFAQDAGSFTTSPVYLNTSKLPRRFKGHDPQQISFGISKRFTPKKEFETKNQYNSRLYKAKSRPILGKLTVDGLFATMVDQTNDDMSGKPTVSYNADAQRMSMILWFTGQQSKALALKKISNYGDSYRASNAFGAETDVIRKDSYEFNLLCSNYNEFGFNLESDDVFAKAKVSAYVPIATARRTKKNLHTLAIYKLTDPYLTADTQYTSATFSYSVEGKWDKYYLTGRLQELWLYDFETGEIVAKVKRRPK